jgi:protein phosphatase
MSARIQASGKTDIGLVRQNNEDTFAYDLSLEVFVVCDGMGGQAAGEKASRIAVNTVIDYFQQLHDGKNANVVSQPIQEVSREANQLANAIRLANRAIREASERNPHWLGMGSTIAALYCHRNQFSIAHVGDSRIYLIRETAIHQLTSDHSFVMEQVRRGLLTVDEAQQSKMQNVIVRALGAEDSVEPDLQDHEFKSGDVLLLCSDGLSRYVQESDIVATIDSAATLEQACDALIDLAKAGGSDDNITCLLVQPVQQPWYKRLVG